MCMDYSTDERHELLTSIFSDTKFLIIGLHDNPDPDAIASGWGLHYYLKRKFGVNSVIAYGGIIARAENKAMVKHLGITLLPWHAIDLQNHHSYALVDTQPGVGNNSLPSSIKPDIVIDHHPINKKIKSRYKSPYMDIRTHIGATASIVYGYLADENISIPKLLATALFYGISSETRNLGREASEIDQRAYIELFPQVSTKILSNITHPKNTREYFSVLARSLNTAMTNDTTVYSHLGEVDHPDYIHQIADLLLTCENIRWSLCTGWWGPVLYLSLRATNTRAKAGVMIRKLVGAHGKAGGHDTMAGGKMEYPDARYTEKMRHTVESLLTRRFARYCGRCKVRDYKPLTTPEKIIKKQAPD